MSPEQARGRFVDQRTDVWAFGCLLFEMLTGQPAFGGEDVMLTLARVLDRDTDLSSIPKTISPAVRHTLKLCLEKDPRRRIADIRDVRLALDGRFETEYPVEDAAVVAAPFWKRALAPVAALVVGGVIVGAAAWFGLKPEPPRITKFADVLPEGVAFHNVADYNIALSRDGKMIAYGANGAIYVRTLGDLEPRRLDQTAGEAPVHLVFSPDGEWIAYWSPAEGELKKVAVQGGSPVTITRAQANPYGPRWTDDDFIVYGRTGSVVRVPASGGQEPEVLFDAGNTTVVAPFVLPGGQKLLVNDGNGRIIGVNLATGESTPLFMGLQPKYLASGHVVYLDDTSIVARTFDPDTFEFGGPVSLVDDVFRSAGAAAQFEVSPSGTLVYIQGRAIGLEAGGTGLAIVAADGTVEPLDVPIRNYLWPRVSPDGRRLAVQVSDAPDQSDIFIYDLSGQSEMRQLTFEGDNNQSPYWKDADTLLFASNRDGRSLIYEQPVAGGRAVPVSDGGPDGDHSAPALTPDGRLTLLAAPASGLPSTWIESDDAFDVLLGGDYLAGVVDFSPDGRAMAYLAQGQSAAEFSIFVEPYPPDGSKRLVSNASELALFPRWVRNGADSPLTLVYQVPTNGAAIAVDVTLPGLELGNRRTLFTYSGDRGTSQIDSIPGSDRFVISWSPGQGGSAADDSALPRRIVVVENWVEELKTRVR
jgi:serine/threonine-protein kinase